MEESIKGQRSESECKEDKGFHMNGKTVRPQACKWPCSLCEKAVRRNSMKYTK